jgi:hypothetical protein
MSARPLGIPIQCVAHLSDEPDAAQQPEQELGQVVPDKNQLILVPPPDNADQSERRFEFDAVYQDAVDSSSLGSLYEGHIMPMLRNCMLGLGGCVFIIGGAKSTKGRTLAELVRSSASGLFELIKQRKAEADSQGFGESDYYCKVEVTFVEIYKEVLTDLLQPSVAKSSLTIHEDATRGTVVKNATAKLVMSAQELVTAFEEGSTARNSASTDFGPARAYTSAVMMIDLQQPDSALGEGTILSRFMLLEVPATNKLLDEPAVLRAREGPVLNKSLLAMQTVCKALAHEEGQHDAADFAQHSSSKLTSLLVDALGGNCLSVVIADMHYHQHDANVATLERLVAPLRRVSTYPVRNDQSLQGLVRRYRMSMRALQEQREAVREMKAAAADDEVQDFLAKIQELEGRVIKDNLEKLQLKEDREGIYAKLLQFRSKYNELVSSKAEVHKSLLEAEEEKLRLSKLLLELRIEGSQQAEKAENEKYELVTKLMNAEDEILQLEMREQNREKVDETLKTQLDDVGGEKKQLAMEFITLKSNYVEVNKQLKESQERAKQLGVELLSLANYKSVSEARVGGLEKSQQRLEFEREKAVEQAQELTRELKELQERLDQSEQLAEQHMHEKARLEIELRQAQVSFEQHKLETDKSTVKLAREKDYEVSSMSKAKELESRRTIKDKSEMDAKMAQLEIKQRQGQRRLAELETALERKTAEVVDMGSEKATLQERLEQEAKNYRVKIYEYIEQLAQQSGVGGAGGAPGGSGSSAQGAEELNQSLVGELMGSYQSQQNELRDEVDVLRRKNTEVVRKNRLLYEKFKEVRHELEDHVSVQNKSGTGMMGKGLVSLPELPDESELKSGEPTQLEDEMEKENAQMRAQLRSLQAEQTNQQEKAVQAAERARLTLLALEQQQQVATVSTLRLEGEKQELRQQVMDLEGQIQAGGGGKSAAASAETRMALKQMKELQTTLVQQMQDIKMAQGAQESELLAKLSGVEAAAVKAGKENPMSRLARVGQNQVMENLKGKEREMSRAGREMKKENSEVLVLYELSVLRSQCHPCPAITVSPLSCCVVLLCHSCLSCRMIYVATDDAKGRTA